MRRLLVGLSLLVAPLAGACVSNNVDGGILLTEAVSPATGCTVSASATEPGVSHGELSSLIQTEYIMTAQTVSRITATADQMQTRTIILTGADVDLSFPGSTLFSDADLADMKDKGITHFRSLFAGALAPNAGITDVSFTITPRALYDAIWAADPNSNTVPANASEEFSLEVVATIVVSGKLDGGDVNSQPFDFPLEISNTNGVYATVGDGTCPLPQGTMLSTGNGCGLPQDAAYTCCEDAMRGRLCPATIDSGP